MAVTTNGLSQELKDENIESAVDVIVAFVSSKKIEVNDLRHYLKCPACF